MINLHRPELGCTPRSPPKDTEQAQRCCPWGVVPTDVGLSICCVCPISHLQALTNGPAPLCHCSNSIHLVIHCADSPRLPEVLIYAWIQCSFYPSLAWEKFMARVLEKWPRASAAQAVGMCGRLSDQDIGSSLPSESPWVGIPSA